MKIKKIKRNICGYIKSFNRKYSIVKILISSIIAVSVFLVLDILDAPSRFIEGYSVELITVIIISVALIMALMLVQVRFFAHFCAPIINFCDYNVLIVTFISLIAGGFWLCKEGFFSYKTIFSIIVFCVVIILLAIRIFFYFTTFGVLEKADRNIYDLKDIYNNQFDIGEDEVILIAEKDVNYDLLDRGALINQLYRTIISIKSEQSFVIGLTGEWGSGKTTLINNVKRKLKENNDEVIIVDNFDPWVFGTQEALLVSMYDAILQKTGMKFSISQNRNIIKRLSATIVNISSSFANVSGAGELLNLFSAEKDDSESINALKEEISMYLKSQKKTVVFIIDNVDRAEADNIIFLFKLIATIFDFPNLIYILSYDKKRIEEILNDTKKINPRYIEKIIQREVHVPAIQQNQIQNIYAICIENILLKYKIDNIKEYKTIFEVICTKVDNLRNFKRLVNSTFPVVFANKHNLNPYDLLAVEVIHFLEPALYEIIRKNYKYFISYHKEYNYNTFKDIFNNDKINKEGKQFFSELFSNFSAYKELLASMFPYVKSYNGKSQLISSYGNDQAEAQRTEKNMSICSAKYFDLYFSCGVNEFLALASKTQEFIRLIKSKELVVSIEKSFNDLLSRIKVDEHKVWIEGLQQYLDEVPQEYTVELALAIWKNLTDIDDSKHFFAINARDRAVYLISILIGNSESYKVMEFAKTICQDLCKLRYINEIIYWLDNTDAYESERVKEIRNVVHKSYLNCCREIINARINMYGEPNYRPHNIWGLFSAFNDDVNKDELLSAYMKDVFSSRNVYRYIGDLISTSIGSEGYGYQIEDRSFNSLYIDEKMIDEALLEISPQTESEQFVFNVYQKYKNGEKNIFGGSGIHLQTEMVLDL